MRIRLGLIEDESRQQTRGVSAQLWEQWQRWAAQQASLRMVAWQWRVTSLCNIHVASAQAALHSGAPEAGRLRCPVGQTRVLTETPRLILPLVQMILGLNPYLFLIIATCTRTAGPNLKLNLTVSAMGVGVVQIVTQLTIPSAMLASIFYAEGAMVERRGTNYATLASLCCVSIAGLASFVQWQVEGASTEKRHRLSLLLFLTLKKNVSFLAPGARTT